MTTSLISGFVNFSGSTFLQRGAVRRPVVAPRRFTSTQTIVAVRAPPERSERQRQKKRIASGKRVPSYKKLQKKQKEGPAAFRQKMEKEAQLQTLRSEREDAQKALRKSRLAARKDAIPLSDLHLGAEMEGIVQNLVPHGAYVDVGAQRDGLVHLRDMSVEFVYAPEDLVTSGDRVKVWVKYVNPVTNVLGLSMRKPQYSLADTRLKIHEVEVGKRYEGVIARITNYGAYIDIGAERLGFLHVSAIWGRHPRETLSELRLGRPIWVHVDEVDESRSRVKLRARGTGETPLREHNELGGYASQNSQSRHPPAVAVPDVVLQRPGQVLDEQGSSTDEAISDNESHDAEMYKADHRLKEGDDDEEVSNNEEVDDETRLHTDEEEDDDFYSEDDFIRENAATLGERSNVPWDEIRNMFNGTEFVNMDAIQ